MKEPPGFGRLLAGSLAGAVVLGALLWRLDFPWSLYVAVSLGTLAGTMLATGPAILRSSQLANWIFWILWVLGLTLCAWVDVEILGLDHALRLAFLAVLVAGWCALARRLLVGPEAFARTLLPVLLGFLAARMLWVAGWVLLFRSTYWMGLNLELVRLVAAMAVLEALSLLGGGVAMSLCTSCFPRSWTWGVLTCGVLAFLGVGGGYLAALSFGVEDAFGWILVPSLLAEIGGLAWWGQRLAIPDTVVGDEG